MPRALAHISLLVRDYDEAIGFFVGILGFDLVADEAQPDQNKRWVVVRPGAEGSSIVLARASTPQQVALVGQQNGGRVFLFLKTDNIAQDMEDLTAKGVAFVRASKTEPYGTVAVFRDLYGNLWDLIEFAPDHPEAFRQTG